MISEPSPALLLQPLWVRQLVGYFLALICLGAISLRSQAQTEIFRDTFANGVVTSSDTITGFWSTTLGTDSSITESTGNLTVTAGGPSSAGGIISPLISSGTPRDDYNFFKRKLEFKADIAIGGTVASSSWVRFSLTGSPGLNYNVEDALVVLFKGDNTVTLSTKQDRAYTTTEGVNVLIHGVNVGGTITGYDFTVDALNYSLVVYFQGGTGSRTFTGTHGLVAAQWGIDGKSTVQFETIRATGGTAGSGQVATANITNFHIYAYAAATLLLEDSFGNGSIADSDLETAIWTAILPQTSLASEATGSLVQTASAAITSANYVVANISTPVQSRFNFFNQQLKISATLTQTGSTSLQSMRRSRLVLASEAGTSGAANDAFAIQLRASSDLTVVTKTDGPNIEIDDSTKSNNKYLLTGWPVIGFYSGTDPFNAVALKINDKRYQFTVYNPGKGSGIARFSGSHNITRSKWGSSGDSSLMLETVRATETLSGATAATTWDNLRVEKDATRLLNEPFWIMTSSYSASPTTTAIESGNFALWLPSTEPVIRGIIFIAPGDGDTCDSLIHDPVAQEAARVMGFGLIGYNYIARMNLASNPTATSLVKNALQVVLDQAAAVSGRPEISNVPVCITGLSRGAFDSGYLVKAWPERVIAFVPHCGGSWNSTDSSDGINLSEAAKKVPGLFVAGSNDGNSLTSPFAMKKMFNWWRTQGGQTAYAVDWGVYHTSRGNQGWEATFLWMQEVARQRYPRPMIPPATPGAIPTLINLDDTAGWLGDNDSFSAATTPSVTHIFTTVAPSTGYVGTPSTASWLPNETSARFYRAMTSTDRVYRTLQPLQGPVRIVSPAQFAEPVIEGNTVTIEVDPREFDNTNALTSMEFYDNDVWLGTKTSGPAWQWSFTPAAGSHSLSVVATDVLGNKRDAFRSLYVQPTNFPPLAYRKSFSGSAATSINGTLTGLDPESNAITFAIAQQPSHGTATINASTGAFTYISNPGYGGTDTFTFTTNDGAVTSTPTAISVTLTVPTVGNLTTANATTGGNLGEISLYWTAAANAGSYSIERSTLSNSGFLPVATVNAPVVSYTDVGLALNQPYFYRIMALNSISQSAYSATVTATPYQSLTMNDWRYLNFGSTWSLNSNAVDLASPNGDGVTNLMKYALGFNLKDTNGSVLLLSVANLPTVEERLINGELYLTCTLTHNKKAPDVQLVVEVTSNLNGTWTTIDPLLPANQVTVIDHTPTPDVETIVVKDTQPISASTQRFMRFKVLH